MKNAAENHDNIPPRKPASGRERSYQSRLRRRCGVKLRTIDLTPEILQDMIDCGLLASADLNDRYIFAQRLGETVEFLFSFYIRHNVPPVQQAGI